MAIIKYKKDSIWQKIKLPLVNLKKINNVSIEGEGNITPIELGLQEQLTPGDNIQIESNVISANQPAKSAIINWIDEEGYTKNSGTVKSVNNTNPDVNGNVSISIPTPTVKQDVINWGFYSKPNTGIPNSDLTNGSNYAVKNANNNFSASQTISGDLTVTGNIIQSGGTTVEEKTYVKTDNDYIILREGATGGLGSGEYTGLEATNYDGTNNGRLAFDSTGTARVGDVGSEQPLLTRSETSSMTNGDLIKWDGTNSKAVTTGLQASNVAMKNVQNAFSNKQTISYAGDTPLLVNATTGTESFVGLQVKGTTQAYFGTNTSHQPLFYVDSTLGNQVLTRGDFRIVTISQSDYNALSSKDSKTLYFITG